MNDEHVLMNEVQIAKGSVDELLLYGIEIPKLSARHSRSIATSLYTRGGYVSVYWANCFWIMRTKLHEAVPPPEEIVSGRISYPSLRKAVQCLFREVPWVLKKKMLFESLKQCGHGSGYFHAWGTTLFKAYESFGAAFYRAFSSRYTRSRIAMLSI